MAATPPSNTGTGSTTNTTPGKSPSGVVGVVAGTNTSWHTVVLWFLGGVALIALADPAPKIATALVLLIILGTLLTNWSIYKTYLGIK